MFTNFKINQAGTFEAVAFLSCEPKTAFGERDRQETAKDGTPKWEIQVLAMTRDQFGKPANGVLKIGIANHKNPAGNMYAMTPIDLVNFEVGVMEKTKKNPATGEEKVIGVQVWYRAEAIRALAATPAPTK